VGPVSCSSSADEHELSDKGLALEEDIEEAPILESGDGTTMEIRRDSDCSTTSSDSNVDESPEVMARVVSQVEFMFSDDHLAKDGFLLKHVRRRSDGFVSLKLVAGLRKVKQISREFSVVLKALQTSSKLEVNGEGSKVRRIDPLTPTLKTMPIKQAKKEKGDKRGGGDGERSFSEKENVRAGSPNNGNLTPSHSSDGDTNDEQSVARKKRHSKFERLDDNQYQYQRGPQYNNNNNNKYHGKQRPSVSSRKDSENSQPLRPRGGSLPVPLAVLAPRGSVSGVYPCSPNNSSHSGIQRPKSNSYSEGSDPCGMSSWLQKRKASAASSRLSTGDICLSGVIRQPRGPDGTRGFVNHPRLVALAVAAV